MGIVGEPTEMRIINGHKGCYIFETRIRGQAAHSSQPHHGGNAIVAGGLPLAVGLALADHLQQRDRVTVCFFGEGAMAEGEFHESMNLAALWHLPILFVCENNLYAMGTALARSESETNLALKAAAYEVPAWSVDGMDVVAVHDAAQRAVDAIRAGGGPHFLEARTFRFRAHSMFDPERYRDKSEVERWKEHDPITTLRDRLTAAGQLSEEEMAAMEQEVVALVDDAEAFAEQSPLEDVADLELFVHSPDSSVVVRAHEREAVTT
jgi:TPP-dependent pyruvate/acetoin dehydrogenase alpha subunit